MAGGPPSFRLLGPLEVRVGALMVPLPGQVLQRALAALLLDAGEPVGVQRLIEFGWGPDGATVAALRTTMSRLRGWLGDQVGLDGALDYVGNGYRLLLPAGAVDAERLHALAGPQAGAGDRAARLACLLSVLGEWRGEVLAGLADWIRHDPVVVRLEQDRVRCCLDLAGLAVALGEPEAALGQLRQVAAAAPYDELLQARLMDVLAARGHRAEALKLFARSCRLLEEELGIGPGVALLEARTRLLRGVWRAGAICRAGVPGS